MYNESSTKIIFWSHHQSSLFHSNTCVILILDTLTLQPNWNLLNHKFWLWLRENGEGGFIYDVIKRRILKINPEMNSDCRSLQSRLFKCLLSFRGAMNKLQKGWLFTYAVMYSIKLIKIQFWQKLRSFQTFTLRKNQNLRTF